MKIVPRAILQANIKIEHRSQRERLSEEKREEERERERERKEDTQITERKIPGKDTERGGREKVKVEKERESERERQRGKQK